jgi:hypothetical protein
VVLDPKIVGDLIIPLGSQFQLNKHLNFIFLFKRAKFFLGCFEFEVLKVVLDPKIMGDLIIPLGPQF